MIVIDTKCEDLGHVYIIIGYREKAVGESFEDSI